MIKQPRRKILRIRFNGHLPQLGLPFNYDAVDNVVTAAKHKYHILTYQHTSLYASKKNLVRLMNVTRNYFTCAQQVPQVNYYNRLY